jgi:hypothetical protein
MACYEARNGGGEAEREADLAEQLEAIRGAIQRARSETEGRLLEVILCTDFNRHNVLWGGPQAWTDTGRRNEGQPIIDLMQEAGLHSLLLAGVSTWEHQTADMTSTVDVILGTDNILDSLEYCRIHDTDYGSDHRPIALRVRLRPAWEAPKRKRRLYKNADWDRIREAVKASLKDVDMENPIWARSILDQEAKTFIDKINNVLEESVPRANESPYAKRWWTPDLTRLRTEFSRKRNRITTLRRRGEDTAQARNAAQAARRTYLDEVDKQKKQH